MQNRVPVKREDRPALPDFTPVPRRNNRHDGWTPERQRAFIEALADTGCVSRAARMVNMAQANCYTLRRAPGAESFRAAWEAALDFGVQRLKDIAFERAIEGQLVPVFVAGKLMGFRRVRNDALLMFCLRHYGQDANGKRNTINYFSSRASAGAVAGDGVGASTSLGTNGTSAKGGAAGAVAETQMTTVQTTVSGGDAEAAARIAASPEAIDGFAGVTLDEEAQAAIMAALADCAARRREADALMERGGRDARDAAEDDPDEVFIRLPTGAAEHRGELEDVFDFDEWEPFRENEPAWERIGEAEADWPGLPPEPPEIVEKRARLADARQVDPSVVDTTLPLEHKRRVKRTRKEQATA